VNNQLKEYINMNKFKEIKKLQKELKDKILAIGKDGIRDFFGPVFDANPKLEKIRWRQYTPYFNDGDPCIFRVHEATVRLNGMAEDAGDYENGFEDSYHFLDGEFDWNFQLPDEEILEQIFGDHTTITVFRNGTIEQDDCEHD